MHGRLTKRLRGADEDGFTLIELLIVIVILGILAAIVVFAIGQTRGDSVASACKTGYKSVELSAEAVKTKTGKYPAVLDASGVPVTTVITDNMEIVAADTGEDAASLGESRNPLVADAINIAKNPDEPFENGALLRDYVKSGDYALRYTAVIDTAATPDKVTGYTLEVGTLSDAATPVFTAVGEPAKTGNTAEDATVEDCDALDDE